MDSSKDNKVNRRRFLSDSTALGVGAAATLAAARPGNAEIDVTFVKDFTPPAKSFIDQYYDGLIEIAEGTRNESVGAIAKAMEKAYECMRNGGNIYGRIQTGHFVMFAGSSDLRGQPNLIPNTREPRGSSATPKKGDFVITNGGGGRQNEQRDSGVYVVGLTCNYSKFAKTPPGFLRSDNGPAMEDVCDLVIDTHVPYYNGLVNAPQIPGFRICPSSGIAMMLVYWACTASLANLIGTKGKGSSTEPAEKYLDLAIDRFRMIGTDRPKMEVVGEKWADLVLGKKARLLVYGRPQMGEPYQGCVNMFVNEAYIVASGSMIARQYDQFASQIKEGDIVLIGSVDSNNPLEINVARYAKSMKAYTTAFTSYGIDSDSSGTHLFKEVDTAFNNYSDESEGVLAIKGFDKKICPLTGVTGNAIHWMVMASWTDTMARRGEMPYYYQGFHEHDGQAYDAAAEPLYLKRGY
ncbi:twin-arginine translocation signal domain-containing protein [bacterium]|nr:twin-arginine translocation signal domain-containing protein [bacterium]